MRRFARNERGASMIIVALAFFVLLGFTAVAIDGGYLRSRHTRLQDVSDASALAGAIEVADSNGNDNQKKDKAFDKVLDYASLNGLTHGAKSGFTAEVINAAGEHGTLTVSFPDELKRVQVDLELNANLFYGKIFGSQTTPIRVTSVAALGQASQQIGNLVPVGVFDTNYEDYKPYTMALGPSDGSSGNFHYVDFSGVSTFGDNLQNGYGGPVKVGDQFPTKTGVSVGLAGPAFQYRIDDCKDATYDSVNRTVINCHPYPDGEACVDSCARIVIVPLVKFITDSTGKSAVEITGFAKFFIISYNGSSETKQELSGVFLSSAGVGDIVPSVAPTASQTAKLIQ